MDIPAAGGIVFDNARRLLLIQRGRPPAAGAWSLPGGKCRPGESTEQACVRELAEETGLTVRVARLAGHVRRTAPDGDCFVIDDYLCTLLAGSLLAADDAIDAGWFDHAALAELDLVPGLYDVLAEWDLLPQ
ncbi:MAG TPA: NUDIX domain-containing protein [Jatrophihabitans sp.]|nr:NUDIX domain-containing protein [Jatrophihabitans sp.]